MAGKFGGRGNVAKRESKIKLVELGPRLRLRLYKVERGVCSGDVLYHAFREDPGTGADESDAGGATTATAGDDDEDDDDASGGDLFADEDGGDDGRAAAEEAAAQGREAPVRAVRAGRRWRMGLAPDSGDSSVSPC